MTLIPPTLEQKGKSSDIGGSSIQHQRQIFCLEMRVPSEHLQCLMPSDGRYLHRIQALFEEPAGCFMPEIVKGDIGEELGIRFCSLLLAGFFISLPSTFHDQEEGSGNGILSHSPDISINSPG